VLLQTMRDTVGNSDLSRDRRRAAAVPAVSALLMSEPRRAPDVLCVYRATPREIIKRSSRYFLAVTPITD
jgi:hypothetical protein